MRHTSAYLNIWFVMEVTQTQHGQAGLGWVGFVILGKGVKQNIIAYSTGGGNIWGPDRENTFRRKPMTFIQYHRMPIIISHKHPPLSTIAYNAKPILYMI